MTDFVPREVEFSDSDADNCEFVHRDPSNKQGCLSPLRSDGVEEFKPRAQPVDSSDLDGEFRTRVGPEVSTDSDLDIDFTRVTPSENLENLETENPEDPEPLADHDLIVKTCPTPKRRLRRASRRSAPRMVDINVKYSNSTVSIYGEISGIQGLPMEDAVFCLKVKHNRWAQLKEVKTKVWFKAKSTSKATPCEGVLMGSIRVLLLGMSSWLAVVYVSATGMRTVPLFLILEEDGGPCTEAVWELAMRQLPPFLEEFAAQLNEKVITENAKRLHKKKPKRVQPPTSPISLSLGGISPPTSPSTSYSSSLTLSSSLPSISSSTSPSISSSSLLSSSSLSSTSSSTSLSISSSSLSSTSSSTSPSISSSSLSSTSSLSLTSSSPSSLSSTSSLPLSSTLPLSLTLPSSLPLTLSSSLSSSSSASPGRMALVMQVEQMQSALSAQQQVVTGCECYVII